MVRMVVTPAKIISVQALYRMRSVQQRLAVGLPGGRRLRHAAVADRRPAGDAGKGRQNEYFVPLVGADHRQAFCRWSFATRSRATAAGSILPSFPQEPAVVKAFLCVYLPETRTPAGRPRAVERRVRRGSSAPLARRRAVAPTPHRLVLGFAKEHQWLRQSGAGFPDRRPTLRLFDVVARPPARKAPWDDHASTGGGSAGSLFAVTSCWATAAAGPAAGPGAGLGAVVIALVLAGVFLPTFSMQILNGGLACGHFHRGGDVERGAGVAAARE